MNPPSPAEPVPRFTAIDLLAILLLALVAAHLETMPIVDRDFWHHLALGQVGLEQGGRVVVDPLTYTVGGESFANLHDGFQRLGAWVEARCGVEGVILGHALLVTASFGALAWLARRKGGPWAGLAAVIFLFLASFQNLNLRPQTLAVPCFAATLAALELGRDRRIWLILPPLVEVFWIRCHGTAPLGILLCGLAAAGQLLDTRGRWTRTEAAFLASAGATALAGVLGPEGLGFFADLTDNARISMERGISEWKGPSFELFGVWIWLLGAIGMIVLVWSRRKTLRSDEIARVVLFALLPLRAIRMNLWWALASAPLLGAVPFRSGRPLEAASRRDAFVIVAIGVLLVALFNPWTKGRLGFLPADRAALHWHDTPLAVGEFLAERPAEERLFHPMEWGAYFAWRLPGEERLAWDPRVVIFPDEVWNGLILASRGEEWRETLDSWEIDTVVQKRDGDWKLGGELERSSEWERIYEDGQALVWTRVQPLRRGGPR